jgi:hypothetical protein
MRDDFNRISTLECRVHDLENTVSTLDDDLLDLLERIRVLERQWED